MTETSVKSASSTSPIPVGSISKAGSVDEAEFSATMTAVLTIGVSDGEDEAEGTSTEETTETSSEEIEIEIEIATFEGDDLIDNLSVTSNRGSTEISITTDGAIGAATDGVFFSDNPEVQMGETLTFTVPEELGDVQGGSMTFSNLVNNESGFESALVTAYNAEGIEVLRLLVGGDESGNVTVDINVGFKSLDVRPVDNGSWTLLGNSDFLIERIDIVTGEAPERDHGGDVGYRGGGFLSDFRSFFEDRNFRLQSAVQRGYRQSNSNVFTSHHTNNAPDYRRDDEVYMRTLEQKNEITPSADGDDPK